MEDAQGIRAEYIGPDMVHVEVNIKVKGDTLVREADQIVERVREKIQEATRKEVKYCSVQIGAQKG